MMTLLHTLVSPLAHNLFHALGWTLVHFCWQGAIVAATLWCALQLLAARSASARYAVACIAFVVLIALPVVTFARLAAAGARSAHLATGSLLTVDPAMLLQINISEASPYLPARLAIGLDHSIPWLLAAWLVGAIFFVMRLNVGLVLASSLKSKATEQVSAELSQLFARSQEHLGIRRVVVLLHSARVHVPTVIGWLRPVVLIPATCLTGLSTEQIEAIFFHELAHVRRNDYLVSIFQSIAEALLFYHPAVWWISRQVRHERECCCDEIAVANGADVLAYAKALSYLEERRAAIPQFALGANGGALSIRIRRLLGCSSEKPASRAAALTLLALMLAAAGSYVATLAHAAQPKSNPVQAILSAPIHAIGAAQEQRPNGDRNGQALSGQYKTWLEQDVVYIITPQERATYLQLKTDDDRDRFINQFWTRRDPPNSPAGTFKADYYTRIAYANQHYAAAGKPGWTTDCGRTYIELGTPFEIESHPSGTADSPPFEIWHYNTTGGQQTSMRFVDTTGDGQYHLVNTAPISQDALGKSQAAAANAHALAPQQPDAAAELRRSLINRQSSESLSTSPEAYSGQPLRKIGQDVTAPVLIYQVEPEFTEEAQKAKFTGVVLVNLVVDQDGSPQNLHIVRGAGMGLDEKAVEAIKQYKFKPAMESGKPVPVALNIEVNFRFADKAPGSADPAKPVKSIPTIQVNSVPSAPNSASTAQDTNPPARKIGGRVSAPILIASVPPEYSPEAKAAKTEGVVLVNLVVDVQGTPQSIRIIRGLPNGLNQNALDAVRQYRFKPAMEHGKPVPVELNIEINYKLF